MCWITLTPKPTRHHHHPHHHHSDHGSSVAELVRVHKREHGPRYSKVRIVAPVEPEKHHHHLGYPHHHPHIHPLHMHPLHFPHSHYYQHQWKLHGHGRKRSPAPPTSAPPPSRSPSSCPSPREPLYRTQIVEPAKTELRETTRVALREVRPERGRLRRVAGYEVLGREVPWDWECVSSAASGVGSGKNGQGRRGRSRGIDPTVYPTQRNKYPPFGDMDRWM